MTNNEPSQILCPISLGELIDKITILRIKSRHLVAEKLENVSRELELLKASYHEIGVKVDQALIEQLEDVNNELWVIEDSIRIMESKKDFGENFVELARAVYIKNDLRASLKKSINQKYGSNIIEEKSYQGY